MTFSYIFDDDFRKSKRFLLGFVLVRHTPGSDVHHPKPSNKNVNSPADVNFHMINNKVCVPLRKFSNSLPEAAKVHKYL